MCRPRSSAGQRSPRFPRRRWPARAPPTRRGGVRSAGKQRANHVIDPRAPSAARVVYDYFGGLARFPMVAPDLMAAVDQADSAQYSLKDILHPSGWVLLNFLMDARTGLGRFRQFRISNYQLMMQLIEYCRNHTVDQIVQLPDVRERVDVYFAQAEAFKAQL